MDNLILTIPTNFAPDWVVNELNETYYDNSNINTSIEYNDLGHIWIISQNNLGVQLEYDGLNRVTKIENFGIDFENGSYIAFNYSSNGKKNTCN